MQIEATSISKYRSGQRLGDDVILIIPGCVYAVFDGATDARGTVIDGTPAGRLAALTVAQATAEAMQDPANRLLPADEIFELQSKALRKRTESTDLVIPPSTTLALALDCGSDWRFLILGDSGIRLNGVDVLQPTKLIDRVATRARLTLYAYFRQHFATQTLDAIELATRRAIFLGLEETISNGQITWQCASDIVAQTIQFCGLAEHSSIVEAFLMGGICTQHRFANTAGTIFGFDTMNGTAPCLGQWIDRTRPKETVKSIEVFTDGFLTPPDQVDLAAWEAEFARMECQDFHMLGKFSAIKGGMSTEHHDDRSLILLKELTE